MRDLPDYIAPPVIETALGVQFAPIEKLQIPYFGMFWQLIKGQYPHSDVVPPLAADIEAPHLEFRQDLMPKFEILASPDARCWFLNEANTELIQVQRDRFLHNWRKVTGIEPYPHYEKTRPAFERDWTLFSEFLLAHHLGQPDVRQCEVAYVNHIDQGSGWDSFADLPNVFPFWAGGSSEGFLPNPESISFNISYLMPERQGRLRVSMVHAFRASDAKETLQLTLTARGKPASSSTADLLRWLDMGRDWVVKAFTDVTSDRMHQLWRRKQ